MLLDRKELLDAAKNEAFARCRYELFAEIAHAEGLHYFAKILEETARNELSHFKEFMEILGLVGDTKSNLKTAIGSETEEAINIYPNLQKHAMADGELDTARLLQQIAKIEERHKERLEKLADLLESDSVYRRNKTIRWKCRICGYVLDAKEPPKKCPGCQSTQEYYEPEDFSV